MVLLSIRRFFVIFRFKKLSGVDDNQAFASRSQSHDGIPVNESAKGAKYTLFRVWSSFVVLAYKILQTIFTGAFRYVYA